MGSSLADELAEVLAVDVESLSVAEFVGVRVNGDFGLDAGLPLLSAIEERADQLFHRDKKVTEANPDDGLASRTPGMRRAEALCELVEGGAASEGNPDRREPLFTIHADEDTYRYGGCRCSSTGTETSSDRAGGDHRPMLSPRRTRRRRSPGSIPTASGHPRPERGHRRGCVVASVHL